MGMETIVSSKKVLEYGVKEHKRKWRVGYSQGHYQDPFLHSLLATSKLCSHS